MNKSQIDSLLQKYWDAETTLKEESILTSYFNSSDIDRSHEEYAALFQYYQSASSEVSTNDISLSADKIREYDRRNGLIMRLKPLLKYAAVFIFMFSGYSIFMNELPEVESDTMYAGKYTELEDEEEALEITLEALSFLSAKINKTEETISQNFIPIQKAINVIN